MKKKMKIALLCYFSDSKLRKNLDFPQWYLPNVISKLCGKSNEFDYGTWISNAISEFEKRDDVEVHILVPHRGISHIHEFTENGIYYHVFWSDRDIIKEKVKRLFGKQNNSSYKRHRNIISKTIHKIGPDIIHVVGIENIFYSMSILDLDNSIPIIVQLQMLVSDERFKNGSGYPETVYHFYKGIEQEILTKADYIGTKTTRYRDIILKEIKPDAIFLDTTLAVAVDVFTDETDKSFDFVYYALDINKAADWAIEAFALAQRKYPDINLRVIGGYSKEYKSQLDRRILELGISPNKIIFEGRQPTHDDVIKMVREARFAILPLKSDTVSGTIREAMANGIPVVTTETPGTPKLNEEFQTVLIAPHGDFAAMANHMCTLLEDPEKASLIRRNALKLAMQRKSNQQVIEEWVEEYAKILNNDVEK